MKKKRIFFSKEEKTTPNFLLPIRSTFHADEDACYLGKIKLTFSTRSECSLYYDAGRIILPALYSNSRERQGECSSLATEEVIVSENERLLLVKQEIKIEMDPLRQAVRMLNTLVPMCDLTQSDENEIILISDDDSDIEPRTLPGEVMAIVQVVFFVQVFLFEMSY